MQLLSFEKGLQTLTNALQQALPQDAIRFNQPVGRIQQKGDTYLVEGNNGEVWQATRLILATPAFITAKLLAELSSSASRALAEIPYNGLAVVHTGFQQQEIPHALDGFGFLVPRKEQLPLLGCIWASSLFPGRAPKGQVLLSNFMGGAHHPNVLALPDEALLALALSNLETVFKAPKIQPGFYKILRYERAIPQYTLGHRQRIQSIETDIGTLPNLALCGNYLHGIALNQCVQSGLEAVKKIGCG